MRVIVIIPARYNSKRFPGKMLFPIGGKALVQHVYDNVVNCKSIDDCIIATDDKRIFDYCERNDLKVAMTRASNRNGTERIAEIALNFDPNDIIINLQGDEPLINCDLVEMLVNMMESKQAPEIATLARVIVEDDAINDPNIVKLVKDVNDFALYFSRACIPNNRDENMESNDIIYYQHIGLYAFRVGVLLDLVQLPESSLEKIEKLEQLRWLEHGYKIKVGVTPKQLIGIDVVEDVNRLELYWKEKNI